MGIDHSMQTVGLTVVSMRASHVMTVRYVYNLCWVLSFSIMVGRRIEKEEVK